MSQNLFFKRNKSHNGKRLFLAFHPNFLWPLRKNTTDLFWRNTNSTSTNSGKWGSPSSVVVNTMISSRREVGERKQWTLNNEGNWRTEQRNDWRKGGGADGLDGDIRELEERKQLARSWLLAKFVKALEDTGDLDGMWVSCILPKYHTNMGNQRNPQRHTGCRTGRGKVMTCLISAILPL